MSELLRKMKTVAFLGAKQGSEAARDEIIEPQVAWMKIQSGAVVLDCRSEKEFSGGAIKNSLNIPHTEIAERFTECEGFRECEVVTYCAVGGRSAIVKHYLLQQGFNRVFNAGGFKDLMSYASENDLFGYSESNED